MTDINELQKEMKILDGQRISLSKRLGDELDAVKLSFASEFRSIDGKINILKNQIQGMKRSKIAQSLRTFKKAIRM